MHDNARHAAVLPGIGYVDAGVVEIMKKQQQGWAYIRPYGYRAVGRSARRAPYNAAPR